MDGFSVASVSATCSSLSNRALSASIELDEILDYGSIGRPASEKLAALLVTLNEFKQSVEELRERLNASPTITDGLQQVLIESLPDCDSVAAIMSKQVKRIGPETPTELINLAALAGYEGLLASHARLFKLEIQLLSMKQPEQSTALDKSESRAAIVQAQAAIQTVKDIPDVLLDGGPPGYSTTSARKEAPAASPSNEDDDLPPTFEEAMASTPSPQPSGNRGESSSSNRGFMSSISSGFKAMAAAMRPKPEPFVSALCQAASRGDIPQIKGFIGEGANINGRNEDGNTALICAVLGNQAEAVRFLLSSGADHTARDSGKKGRPPFFHAVEVGSEPIIEQFLKRGVDINEKSIYGQPFFVDVINNGKLEAVKFLLSHGANPNTTEITGSPIVALATKKGNLPLVKLLLEFGANINSRDNTGQAILVLSFNQSRDDLVELLLSRGADPNTATIHGTPLVMEAFNKGNFGLVKALLERGANANVSDIMGNKLLTFVVKSNTMADDDKEKLAKLLLSRGANANETDGWNKPTVFGLVLAADSPNLAKMFLEHGANPNVKLPSGETYLLSAMDRENWGLVRMLLQFGAIPNEPDKGGRTPLIVALQLKKPEIVTLLVQHGADVNKLGSISPLAFARATGDLQTEELLTRHGARDPTGKQ